MNQRKNLLVAIGMLALATTTNLIYASDNHPNVSSMNRVEQNVATKIYISGNVEVTLVQDVESKELYQKEGKVKVWQDHDIVFVKGNKNTEKAKVVLYIGEISRIDIADNASVHTKNRIETKYLQLILKDHAVANINSRTESLFTKLSNESTLKLNGLTLSHTISTNELAKLDIANLKSMSTEIERRNDKNYASTEQ